MADRTMEREGRERLTFAPKDKDDERGKVVVYAGTGLFDALSTDPNYELVDGDIEEGAREAPANIKPATGPKTDMVPDPSLIPGEAESRTELDKLSREALNDKALDLRIKSPEAMPNKGAVVDAIIEAEKAIRGQAAPA